MHYEKIMHHKRMLADQVRMVSYQKAIHETVRKGDIVVDIGTGSGILAFFAIQAGAKKVYAIEKSPVIHEAMSLAKINDLEKKTVFIEERSDKVELPEKVDVIVSELMGLFGLEENLLRFLFDAKERFLKPGGKLVPSWLELYVVPVASEATWRKYVGFWKEDFYGVDFSSIRNTAASQTYRTSFSDKIEKLASPSMITRLDVFKHKKKPLMFTAKFTISKKNAFHGLVGYFKAGLSKNIVLSTAPSQPITHWEQLFFPLKDVLSVEVGDEVYCAIKAIPKNYNVFWQWETHLCRKGAKIAAFSQSNYIIDKEALRISRKDYKPELTQEAKIHRRIFELCDGNKTVEEIAHYIMADYPGKYKNINKAFRKVVRTLQAQTKRV
ncbi:50S ribosomal protein L11 methyltransferase [Candidatus Omnitrophota bacterium]